MKNKFIFSVLIVCAVLISNSALANFFLWHDVKNDFTFSFPDTWQMQHPVGGNAKIRVVAPITEDRAQCQVEMVEDKRFDVYPKTLMQTVVEENMGRDFWQTQLAGKYKQHNIVEFYSPSIMGGRGDATAIRYSFTSHDDERMYGAMIGSIYGSNRYVVECGASREKFDTYAQLFSRIMESVQLEQKYPPFAIGYYRDFLSDRRKFHDLSDKPGTLHHKGRFNLRALWPFSINETVNR